MRQRMAAVGVDLAILGGTAGGVMLVTEFRGSPRQFLILMEPGLVNPDLIIVYATTSCSDCRLAKSVLDEAGVRYRLIDLDQSQDGVDEVLKLNGGYRTVPTIVFPDGRVLVEPNRRELLLALGRPL